MLWRQYLSEISLQSPSFARVMLKSEGFTFPSTDSVTQSENSLLYDITIFMGLMKRNLPQRFKYMIFSNVLMFTSLLSGLKVRENKTEQ